MLNGFFDIDFRLEELDKAGDPLTKLNEVVNWESFREELESMRDEERKSNAGRKPFAHKGSFGSASNLSHILRVY